LEIFNENIRDLLAFNQKEEKDMTCKHEIKHSRDGQTSVTDMSVVKMECPEQVRQLLKRAAKNRATAATDKNERSSRSHRFIIW
jgi:kinesin family member C1